MDAEYAERVARDVLADMEGWRPGLGAVLGSATECARIRPEFLERENKMMGEWRYAQEYGCGFVDNGDSYFTRESVERCFVDNEWVLEV